MSDTSDCLFCRIIAGEIRAEVLETSPNAIAIKDTSPQAPVHALVIPREHSDNVARLAQKSPAVLAELVELGESVAQNQADGEFRLIFNSGARAGQSVNHVHGHVLAGTELGWNPA
ncbi:MAG: HIT domain-containing protein [Promicromonosporaceae bacterium]|nr:HIT domain-containing protein [Promicromonosporaceae bacterium]